MEVPSSSNPTPNPSRPPNPNRRRQPGPRTEDRSELEPSDSSADPARSSRGRYGPRQPRRIDGDGLAAQPSEGRTDWSTDGSAHRNRGTGGRGRGRGGNPQYSRRQRPKPTQDVDQTASSEASTHTAGGGTSSLPRRPQGRRAAKFNPNLTTDPPKATPSDPPAEEKKPSERYRRNLPQGDDLTSTLIRSLSTPPFPDCLICFAPIHPAQSTWSCSPLIPTSIGSDDEKGTAEDERRGPDTAQCCWTTFHLKCIRSWASKSVKDIADAWRARGEERQGVWRCPGCQSKRATVPGVYW